MKSLIIVESPSKTPTIQKFTGGVPVFATCGHFLKLKSIRGGVDVENGVIKEYRVLNEDKSHYINDILAHIKNNDSACVYLALDNDDEGHAIAYDIAKHICKKTPFKGWFKRVYFSSLSGLVIKESILSAKNTTIEELKEKNTPAKNRRIVDAFIAKYYTNKSIFGIGRVSGSVLSIINNGDQLMGEISLKINTTAGLFTSKIQFNVNDHNLWLEREKNVEAHFKESPLVLNKDFNINENISYDGAMGFNSLMSFLLANVE